VDTLEEASMGVMERRKRRAFTKEFKAETIRLVVEGGQSIPEVARDLDLTESALRAWVRQAEVDAGRGKPGALTTEEREELGRLRREVKTLRHEREILKKAAATAGPSAHRRDETSRIPNWFR
jgi:transposase-like protein